MKKSIVLLIASAALLSVVLLSAEKNMPQSGAEVKVLWDDPTRQEFVATDVTAKETGMEDEQEMAITKDTDAGVQIKVGPEVLQYLKAYVPAVMQFLASLFQEQEEDALETTLETSEDEDMTETTAGSNNHDWANLFESIIGKHKDQSETP